MLPELTELTNDEEPHVRETALEALADMVPHLPVDTVRSAVVPLVQKICQHSLTSPPTHDLCGVARLVGKLSHQLRGQGTLINIHIFKKIYNDKN